LYQLGSANEGQRAAAVRALEVILVGTSVATEDLINFLITRVDQQMREQINALLSALWSPSREGRNDCYTKLSARIDRQRKTWNDVFNLIATDTSDPGEWTWLLTGTAVVCVDTANVQTIDCVRELIYRPVAMTDDETATATLWAIHTHFAWSGTHTPRLAILGPVGGTGKTTLLNVLGLLVARPHKSGAITEAGVYRLVEERHPTLLLDEFDNADLRHRPRMRAILNTGHQRGWPITICENGEIRQFETYCPLAFSGIGLPYGTPLHRTIRMNMQRHDGSRILRRELDYSMFDAVYQDLCDLSQQAKLNPDPAMPQGVTNRIADNWRQLIAIGDLFGPDWGERARQLAVAMSKGHDADDRIVTLLWNVERVLKQYERPSMGSQMLCAGLWELPESPYVEWRGINDDQPARRLTPHMLADLLSHFGLRPRTVWPHGNRRPSCRGYAREWFEPLWRRYPQEP
jgi:hypothetical protein